MFKNLIMKIKEVLYRMNIIKGIKDVTKLRDIQIDEAHFNRMDRWKAQYRGFDPVYMNLEYQTLDGKQTRTMATLNMPKIIAAEMASLVFNEKCEISISDETFGDNVKNVLSTNNFNQRFQRYLEYMFGIGGIVIKVYAEDGKVKISFVPGDSFLPVSWSADEVNEGVFINETIKGEFTYTLLEWNLWEKDQNGNLVYVVRNELYKKDKSKSVDELGVKVNLSELYPKLAEEVPIEKLSRPLFVYVKPNTANNFDMLSPLGIPLYANSLDLLRAIDTAFDSFEREFKLGKKKIIVPDSALKYVVNPETGAMNRYFDSSDEVYQSMKYGELDAGANAIKEISMELRVEEHIAGINALLNHLSMSVGFSAGAFTFDSGGLKTATEVVSENSKTFRSKQSHEVVIEAAINNLVTTIGEVAALYNIFPMSADKELEVAVSFDDSIAEDETAISNRWVTLVGAGLASKKQAIKKIQKVTDEEADQILKDIAEDFKRTAQGSADMIGLQ